MSADCKLVYPYNYGCSMDSTEVRNNKNEEINKISQDEHRRWERETTGGDTIGRGTRH